MHANGNKTKKQSIESFLTRQASMSTTSGLSTPPITGPKSSGLEPEPTTPETTLYRLQSLFKAAELYHMSITVV